MKLNRPDEARAEFERAAAMTSNAAERDLSAERARAAARAAADADRFT
jgi:predicted RNA polymerase sigma factor